MNRGMEAASRRLPVPLGPSLAVAAALVAFGFIGSRLLGVVRSSAISYQFGTAGEVEAYFVAFRIPDLIFQVLAGATLGSAFIPVFARLWRQEGDERAWELASAVLNAVTLATAVLCVLAFALAGVLVPLTAPGLDAELTDKAVTLTRIMLVSPFLFAVGGIVTGILQARQQFLLPALAPMLYNAAIIVGALGFARIWGIEGLAIGVVVGAGLHLGVQVPGLVRERMRYRAILGLRDVALREVTRLMGPRVIGLAAGQLNFVIIIFFASRIGEGAISSLTFAWLVATLPLALFGMAISTAVFPTLAEQAADGESGAVSATVSRTLRVIMFLTLPAALGLAFLAEPVVRILFERGEFGAASTHLTAAALVFYCISIVPQAGNEIHSRGFYALGDTRTPVVMAVVAMVVNLALSAALWSRFGVEGLAFALSAAACVEWALLWAAYARRTGANPLADLAVLARMSLAAATTVLFVAVALRWLEPSGGQWDSLVTVSAAAVAGASIYGGLALVLRIEEAGEAASRLLRLVGRR